MTKWIRVITACALASLIACSNSAKKIDSAEAADLIITGGPIVTMDSARPSVEAVAIKDGKILAAGSVDEVGRYSATTTQQLNLDGHTLVPGFIDGHSHFSQAISAASWANVSGAPVGTINSIADIITEMQALKLRNNPAGGEWLVGYGYDADTLSDGRNLNRDDLDAAFPNNPVVLIHVSFHGAVLNSKAFAAIGYDESTKTPEGGIIVRREENNEPSGLIMETAWFPAAAHIMQPDKKQRLVNLKKAQEHYASNGVTTAQDGATSTVDFGLFQEAAARGDLFIDLVVLGSFAEVPAFLEQSKQYSSYNNRLKIGGIKLVTDGSPQGKTAFFTEPFLTGGPGGETDWRGEPLLPAEEFEQVLAGVYKAGVQAFVHANADAAVDMVLNAHKKFGHLAGEDSRTVVIHSQFIRPDQLNAYSEYDMVPSFFSNHAYFWGDVHVKNLGVKRAHFLSPMKTASDMGIHFTNHSDYMVTPLNPLFTMWSAVNRVSRSGQIIGADQRITAEQALKSITLDGAWQYFEEKSKGSITANKLADLVILDANPLTVDPMEIKNIKVLATYKEGRKIY
ncbi:MAG: amidohydrolase [Halioglobus sp.]